MQIGCKYLAAFQTQHLRWPVTIQRKTACIEFEQKMNTVCQSHQCPQLITEGQVCKIIFFLLAVSTDSVSNCWNVSASYYDFWNCFYLSNVWDFWLHLATIIGLSFYLHSASSVYPYLKWNKRLSGLSSLFVICFKTCHMRSYLGPTILLNSDKLFTDVFYPLQSQLVSKLVTLSRFCVDMHLWCV